MERLGETFYIVGKNQFGSIPIDIENSDRCTIINLCVKDGVLTGMKIENEFCEVQNMQSHISKMFPTFEAEVNEIVTKIIKEKF